MVGCPQAVVPEDAGGVTVCQKKCRIRSPCQFALMIMLKYRGDTPPGRTNADTGRPAHRLDQPADGIRGGGKADVGMGNSQPLQ